MFAAGSDLAGKSEEEIYYQDYKTFEFNERKLGVAQINSLSARELAQIKERMIPFLQKKITSGEVDMIIFMLTNIIEESSEMLCFGEHADRLVEEAFPQAKVENNAAVIPAVVSRKKQVIPALMSAMSRNAEI